MTVELSNGTILVYYGASDLRSIKERLSELGDAKLTVELGKFSKNSAPTQYLARPLKMEVIPSGGMSSFLSLPAGQALIHFIHRQIVDNQKGQQVASRRILSRSCHFPGSYAPACVRGILLPHRSSEKKRHLLFKCAGALNQEQKPAAATPHRMPSSAVRAA